MILKVYPENPNSKTIEKIVDVISKGGVVVYPTDTVYSFGCSIHSVSGIERIAKLKNIDAKKYEFTVVFDNISHISQYAKAFDNQVYKILKRHLPGPFTFILESNNELPKHLRNNSKTIGVRIPNHSVPLEIIRQLKSPIISTSVYVESEVIEYTTDPELIDERYGDKIDLIIDSGYGNTDASTVVDCTTGNFEIIRQGLGIFSI